VGATAGPVVYPRSPVIVVPIAVLVYVLERMPNVFASPRPGSVAAWAAVETTVRLNVRAMSPVTDETTPKRARLVFRKYLETLILSPAFD